MTPEQQEIAAKYGEEWCKQWRRCEDCDQYLREKPLSYVPCPHPENHGPEYVFNHETRRMEKREVAQPELLGVSNE
jgi:hypothetical protein